MIKQNWIKKGLIIKPNKKYDWMQSHAMLPSIFKIKDNDFLVYFSGRNKDNISIVSFVKIRIIGEKVEVLNFSETPVLSYGERGCFDDNGVTPSCIIQNNKELYMYYIGWNSGNSKIRMSLVAGLAISTDMGITFKRYSRAPLLTRNNLEPFSILTAPCVLFSKEKKIWEMWYVSCEGWRSKDLPTYNIKYSYSNNGIDWIRNGEICIDFINDDETALARPWVIFEDNKYKMWFSFKGEKTNYKMGYAESNNGIDWNRINGLEILDYGKDGDWDSEMIEYPCVFNHNNLKFMLYNGNNYGENGIGYAVKRNQE